MFPAALRRLTPVLRAVCVACLPIGAAMAQPGRTPVVLPPAIDSARAAAARGALDEAVQWYDRALVTDSTNRVALRESAALLAGRGQWQRAMPRLGHLVRLGEDDAMLNHDFGQFLVWDRQVDSGTVHLRKAVAQAPDSVRWRFALGQALTWDPAKRAEGLRVLLELERAAPRDTAVRQAIAAAMSWDPTARGEASRRFRDMLRDDPQSVTVRLDYADMLSWIVETRDEAMALYVAVQRDHPGNVRAALGRLNVLTWTNRSTEALALADSLLASEPGNATLRRSRGSLLLQMGRVDEAVAALRPLVEASPRDYTLLEPFGYALLAQGTMREARRVALRIPEGSAPGGPDWIRRGAAPGLGIDGVHTSNSFGLATYRVSANASTPVTRTQRLVVSGGPVHYVSPTGDFDGTFATVGVTGRAGPLIDTRAEVGIEQFRDAPSTWVGRLDGSRPLAGGGVLRLALRRSLIEDSRLAARGDSVNGAFIGQVRNNALDMFLKIPEFGKGIGLQASSTLGAYTGRGLRTNWRRELTATVTTVIPLGGQRLEAGLGATGLSFAFDANRSDTPLRDQGRYWSPTSFANAIMTLGMSLPITGRLVLRADVTGGRQIAGRIPGANVFNMAGGGTLRWTGYRGWDLASGFLYIDNLGGFQLRQWSASLRKAW